MSGCKILDPGAGDATHFGHALGGGVYVHGDAKGNVTLCRHPGDNVRATPDVSIALTSKQWTDAIANVGTTPAAKKPAAKKAKKR